MNHEYRESPYTSNVCAACGRSFALCQGVKRVVDRQSGISMRFIKHWNPIEEAVSPWDAWCARFGIDPNTPDETVLDDYLHGRTPQDRFRNALAHQPQWLTATARAEVYELERWLKL